MSKNRISAKTELLKALGQMSGLEPTNAVLEIEPLRTLFLHFLDLAGSGPFAVFGYGSLMWNPEFKPETSKRAKVYGYARQPCIKSTTYRGTPERPGLVFGLDIGGSCTGIAHGIPPNPKFRKEVLSRIFVRECFQGVYLPTMINAYAIDSNLEIPCVTFVANRKSSAYTVPPGKDRLQKIVTTARGRKGPCIDYWTETERHCNEIGINWKHGLDLG